jgi:hypothetical protein
MDCFCGCGQRVSRRQTAANLRLAVLAVELLAWDRFRTRAQPAPAELVDVDRLVD